ncbi:MULTISPECIES: aldehyde dehydrogenase [Gordonibacter]|uniref:Aldehyde dehydrogenase n=1 Tax=Gordonibacter faecis TaxID=3047475 RepID=A0ABT7DJM2_9ACTN|nr:aldehyde dehydrogenase [Gordonibacter sp. KGMB12511]MDJ1649718.1 aldehyde dehydrogenase [Gordonibacter sp. KGMB12511]
MSTIPTYESIADVEAAAQKMRDFHATGATLQVEYRRRALQQLRAYLKANEDRILAALQADLGKAPFEGYATELGIVYDEISTCLKHLNSWSRPRRVASPIVHFHSTSKVYPSPLGVVLVLSPWNYPLQLALVPLVDAIAAGNCVALKPSRTSKATSDLLIEMLADVFPPEFVCGFPGSGAMNDWLLEVRWDQLFFTGSPNVGHTIMAAAAKHLTPVVLELGGKSPCIVDETANVKRAAQRVAWGKGINCGQTCVAPDYFLVHESVVDDFVAQLDACFYQYYGENILACDEWPHMISQRHFERVMGLIEHRNPNATVAFGGHGNPETLRIEPTCLRGVTLDDPVMNEEIFGPVLPILTYRALDQAFDIVRTFEKPLACYVFSDDKSVQHRVLTRLQFGGATVNDVVIHLANNHMGFGGVGNSGMGAYHGKTGFDCFTHYKSTMKKGTWLELPIRNPPFGNKIKLLHMLMR